MFWGYKTYISWLFVKHCEQTYHLPGMQRHLEKVEALEVLHCNGFLYIFVRDYISDLTKFNAYQYLISVLIFSSFNAPPMIAL